MKTVNGPTIDLEFVETASSLNITIYGAPAPQGSKKFVGVKAGRGIMIESSKAVKPWREAVKSAAIDAMRQAGAVCLVGAVSVEMIFTLPKPKSAPKRSRSWPDRKPDLSKLVRSTEDALTDIGAWEDDARIVSCLSRKVFPGEDPDALNVPGAVIRLSRQRASYTTEAELTKNLLGLSKSIAERTYYSCRIES